MMSFLLKQCLCRAITSGLLGLAFFNIVLPIKADPNQAISAPYLDITLRTELRVKDLVSRLTLQEKVNELDHSQSAIPRLGIRAWNGWNQAIHGVWAEQPTTLFPVPIALAATWDPDLIRTDADAISDEARALYNLQAVGPQGPVGLVYRSPVINISRHPLWGRIQECYGEDPYLTGSIGTAYIQGLQGNNPKYLKVAATVKHFAVNNQEDGRLGLEAQVPERALYEYWLPHWKQCIQVAKPQSVMAAYNGINGLPCAINTNLLTHILRDQWGFDGFVVSDLGGIKHLIDGHHLPVTPEEAAAKALLAGCDTDDAEFSKYLPFALSEGLIKEADIDRSVCRALTVAFRLGVFDPPQNNPYNDISADVINSADHRTLALKTAHEAIVLLQNRNNMLPLDQNKLKSIAVIGPCGDRFETGNYFGKKPHAIGALEALLMHLDRPINVTYSPGCGVVNESTDSASISAAVVAAKNADLVLLCVGTTLRVEAEGRDRKTLQLPGQQEALVEAVAKANPKTIIALFNGGPLSIVWEKDHVPAILDTFYNGEEAGTALIDVLFGDYDPSGRLPYTMYVSANDVPPMTDYDVADGFTYMYCKVKPLYPFGYGLSYTHFHYGKLLVTREAAGSGSDHITASVNVRNIGKTDGGEVVQLYVHQSIEGMRTPVRKLIGFERVHIKSGASETVRFDIPVEQLAFYNVDKHLFQTYPGSVEFTAGGSSAETLATASLRNNELSEFKP